MGKWEPLRALEPEQVIKEAQPDFSVPKGLGNLGSLRSWGWGRVGGALDETSR